MTDGDFGVVRRAGRVAAAQASLALAAVLLVVGAVVVVIAVIVVVAALNLVREWTKGARCERPVLCFSDPRVNYRKIVDPHYKANRKGLARPLAFQAVVDELYAHHRCVTLPALEADDVMGILHTNGRIP